MPYMVDSVEEDQEKQGQIFKKKGKRGEKVSHIQRGSVLGYESQDHSPLKVGGN